VELEKIIPGSADCTHVAEHAFILPPAFFSSETE
jgi:hypothetical protein